MHACCGGGRHDKKVEVGVTGNLAVLVTVRVCLLACCGVDRRERWRGGVQEIVRIPGKENPPMNNTTTREMAMTPVEMSRIKMHLGIYLLKASHTSVSGRQQKAT